MFESLLDRNKLLGAIPNRLRGVAGGRDGFRRCFSDVPSSRVATGDASAPTTRL
jgi:hypothetical protein